MESRQTGHSGEAGAAALAPLSPGGGAGPASHRGSGAPGVTIDRDIEATFVGLCIAWFVAGAFRLYVHPFIFLRRFSSYFI